jgi:peroxiredoxin
MQQQPALEEDLEDRPSRRFEPAGVLRFVVFPAAVLALILGGLWYLDTRLGSSSSNGAYGVVALPTAKNPTGKSPAAAVGRTGPDFLLETPDGGTLRFSDFQGHPVLLNFWASWCAPCRQEMPRLVAAYDRYRDQGLIIVGVDLQEPVSKVTKFAAEFGIDFPLAIDRDGQVADAWRIGGPVQGLPSSYFVDATGVIQYAPVGGLTEDLLNKGLAKILPQGAS